MDDVAHELLRRFRIWAVVGCSPDPSRDSNRVARALQARGYQVVPIHPGHDEVLGEPCWPSLLEVPPALEIEVVDLFRRSDQVGVHVDEAIAIGARAVWFQLGVRDDLAARRAWKAGLHVVQNRCPAVELPRVVATARV
jgi:predicted CoA-binding protein